MNQLAKMKVAKRNEIPVILCRGDERHCFDTCKHAAQFLAKREHYSISAITYHFGKRHEEIYGWRINYQR